MKNTKDQLVQLLKISSVICILLVMIRFIWTSSFSYFFLLWNLFLAWIPLFLAGYVRKLEQRAKSGFILTVLFFTWLLFFPNAPYILTDLVHLYPARNMHFWYDLILILLCAWNGLILGLLSLFRIHRFLLKIFTPQTTWVLIYSIIVVSSFGIYLGRVQRFNSWDVIADPLGLASHLISQILHPFNYPGTLGITCSFSVFLVISYLTFFNLQKARIDV